MTFLARMETIWLNGLSIVMKLMKEANLTTRTIEGTRFIKNLFAWIKPGVVLYQYKLKTSCTNDEMCITKEQQSLKVVNNELSLEKNLRG